MQSLFLIELSKPQFPAYSYSYCNIILISQDSSHLLSHSIDMHVPAISGSFSDAHKNMVLHTCTTISSDCHPFYFMNAQSIMEMISTMRMGHDWYWTTIVIEMYGKTTENMHAYRDCIQVRTMLWKIYNQFGIIKVKKLIVYVCKYIISCIFSYLFIYFFLIYRRLWSHI